MARLYHSTNVVDFFETDSGRQFYIAIHYTGIRHWTSAEREVLRDIARTNPEFFPHPGNHFIFN